jgi:hypothetical protein
LVLNIALSRPSLTAPLVKALRQIESISGCKKLILSKLKTVLYCQRINDTNPDLPKTVPCLKSNIILLFRLNNIFILYFGVLD